MNRIDAYAKYSCGHIEADDTSHDAGSTSYCNTCKQPAMIVIRLIDGEYYLEQQKKAQLVRGAIIGALAGGHLEGLDGSGDARSVLLQIADLLGLELPAQVKGGRS